MINLRLANTNEAEKILEFYRAIIKSTEYGEFNPKWNDKYPNLEFIEMSITNEELFVYDENNEIIACVIVNDHLDGYGDIEWHVDAKDDEITAVHTYAVNPSHSGKGIGRKIFNNIKNDAKAKGKKAIRIDVIDGNLGAQKVFTHLGFEYIETVEMFRDAVGREKFHLYEFEI